MVVAALRNAEQQSDRIVKLAVDLRYQPIAFNLVLAGSHHEEGESEVGQLLLLFPPAAFRKSDVAVDEYFEGIEVGVDALGQFPLPLVKVDERVVLAVEVRRSQGHPQSFRNVVLD
jgi:hypothetical protein